MIVIDCATYKSVEYDYTHYYYNLPVGVDVGVHEWCVRVHECAARRLDRTGMCQRLVWVGDLRELEPNPLGRF